MRAVHRFAFVLALIVLAMSWDLRTVLAEAAPKINEMIKSVTSGDDRRSRIKTVADTIVAYMLEKNLAYKDRLRPSCVGVHPDNRFSMDGLGASGRARVDVLHREGGLVVRRGGWCFGL